MTVEDKSSMTEPLDSQESASPARLKIPEPRDYWRWGKNGTAIWGIIIGILILFRLSDFKELSINSWGDFLAGATGPVAFLWLVLGFLQQREELKQNTSVLRDQAGELEKQAQELKNQVAELSKSVVQQTELTQINKQMIEHEIEKTLLASQPVIVVGTCDQFRNDQLHGVRIGLINHGHSVTTVRAKLSLQPEQVWGDYKNYWENGTNFEFSFDTTGLPFPLVLTISYRDGLFKIQEQTFWVIQGSGPTGYEYHTIEKLINFI